MLKHTLACLAVSVGILLASPPQAWADPVPGSDSTVIVPDAAGPRPADAGATVTIEPTDTGPAVTVVAPDVNTCPPGYAVKSIDAKGSIVCLPASSANVANPASTPVAAWTDEKAAKKTGWPFAIWLGLAMAGKALAYARDKFNGVPVLGKVSEFLGKGRTAMIVAGVGAIGAAGYDALLGGGSWAAALSASAVAIAGVARSTVGMLVIPPTAASRDTQPPATT